MELDFTRLNEIASSSAPTQGAMDPEHTQQPEETQEETVSYARLDMEQKAYRDMQEAYRQYQENIRNAGTLQAEILKGLQAGEDTGTLLLKACKAISQMTGNTSYYEQVEANLISIYGEGLLQPALLERELETVTDRLARLEASMQRDTLGNDERNRIEKAVKAHREKVRDLQELIGKNKRKEEEAV